MWGLKVGIREEKRSGKERVEKEVTRKGGMAWEENIGKERRAGNGKAGENDASEGRENKTNEKKENRKV